MDAIPVVSAGPCGLGLQLLAIDGGDLIRKARGRIDGIGARAPEGERLMIARHMLACVRPTH